MVYYSQKLNPVAQKYPSCLRASTATAFLVKETEEAFNHLCTLYRRAPELSHSTFCSQPPNLLRNPFNCSSHNLSYCNKLNLAILLSSITEKAPHDCLTMMDHLLTFPDYLQETLLSNIDFSWFTDGSYLKGENGKYCCICNINIPRCN